VSTCLSRAGWDTSILTRNARLVQSVLYCAVGYSLALLERSQRISIDGFEGVYCRDGMPVKSLGVLACLSKCGAYFWCLFK
jgi:hypothetical protein